MKSHLELIPTGTMNRDAWLGYRKSGVGASEVGAILGLSPYKSSIELFYDKIGESVGYNVENIFMFMGLQSEDLIANLWQYWEGSEESIIENYRIGKVVRRSQRVNAYVRNPKFPWLFVSLDRKINKTATRGEGALELKTISGYESDKWEVGIPPSHVVQVQAQCLVCEFEFGELCTLKDGRRFEVLPFDFRPELGDQIAEKTKAFWEKVETGRKIITQRFEAERIFNYKAVQELSAQLHELEPEPDGSDAYSDFLKKKFAIATPGELKGTDEDLQDARKHAEIKIHIKTKQEEAEEYENKLKRTLGEFDVLDFGDNGRVSWKGNKNGVRSFLNKIKLG